jgi:putative oxidoreductase
MERFLGPFSTSIHAALRIVAGFLFFQHGLPKLFGGFGSPGPAELFSQMGLAGVIEVFGGGAIALGLFTSPWRTSRRICRADSGPS